MTNETRINILQARMHLLQQRDPEGNRNIINKIRRRLRLLEGQ